MSDLMAQLDEVLEMEAKATSLSTPAFIDGAGYDVCVGTLITPIAACRTKADALLFRESRNILRELVGVAKAADSWRVAQICSNPRTIDRTMANLNGALDALAKKMEESR